ncbi:MAG: DNA repair protein RecO [Weeksellaceae bacterium]
MEKTRGFVIKTLKYGDTSAILKVYTEAYGTKSFIQKGFFNPKKRPLRSLQFPFAMAEFSFKLNQKSTLILPSQISPIHSFTQLFQHPIKMMMMQFLAEVTGMVLKEEEDNLSLFSYLETQFKTFNDKLDHFADFHLIFLMQLTQHLGFSPNTSRFHYPYFDMQEGIFIPDKNATFLLNEQETMVWKRLIQSEFKQDSVNLFNQIERNALSHMLLNYYKLHIPGFKEPHSLEIIKEVFNS